MIDLFGEEVIEELTEKKPKVKKEIKVKEPKNPLIPFSASLLKSAVQKAVRRNDAVRAVRCAKSLIDADPVEGPKRISVIVLEDVILHPKFCELMDIVWRSVRKEPLTKEDKDFILGIVYDLAASEWRDGFLGVEKFDEQKLDIERFDEVGGFERKMIAFILARSKMWGMKGDLQMFIDYAQIWGHRFLSSKEWTIDKLNSYFENKKIDYNEISYAKDSDILLEAVDFHCSPILNVLMKKDYITDFIKNKYPYDEVEQVLKAVIWKLRSAPNFKKQITDGKIVDHFVDFRSAYGKDDEKNFREIYKVVFGDLEGLAKWWIKLSSNNK